MENYQKARLRIKNMRNLTVANILFIEESEIKDYIVFSWKMK